MQPIYRAAALLLSSTMVIAWLLLRAGAAATTHRQLSAPPWAELYRDLSARTIAAAASGAWPDPEARSSLSRGLRPGPRGPEPVRFETDGPLQCAAFFRCEGCEQGRGLALVRDARQLVFEPFVADILQALPPWARRQVESGLHWPKDAAIHICVTVFSEHPSLLDTVQQASWRAVDDAQIESLAARLAATALSAQVPAVELRLHGYAVTPDGSMIITFDEVGDASQGLSALRERVATAGAAELGELNSRPKRLIHITCGRLLVWPHALDQGDAWQAARVAGVWARALVQGRLPLRAGRALRAPNLQARVRLAEIELCRDVRWMMGERHTYRTFSLKT